LSSTFRRFAGHCRSGGVPVCEVRDPGGTLVGEQIRAVLLNPDNDDMSLRCEMMLYMASRAQLVEETIRPALQRGELVLADRFISSTLAYQGTAGGMSRQEILAVGRVAIHSTWPDLTVIFDVDEGVAGTRLDPLLDRMERRGAEFHARVRRGFCEQAQTDPEKYLLIDASGDADSVFTALLKGLEQRFG
jgi:dTMP kinase